MENRYDKYKDSGIAWIGEIPEHWEVIPHKRIMRKKKIIKEFYAGENILSLTKKGVIIRDLEAGGKMPTTFNGYQVLYPDNLLMCLFDIDVTPRCVGIIKDEGLSSPAYSQFILNKLGYTPFFDYLLRYMDDEKCLLHLSKNLRNSLTEDDFGQIETIVPSFPEQQAIADYLDWKCGEIDELITLQEEMITKLQSYKQSVITEAVTKGLDKNVPLKDSGIEWIGEIPEHWEVRRMKSIYNFGKGLSITKADLVDKGIPVISYGQIHSKLNIGTCIKDSLIRYVPKVFLENNNTSLVKKGDVIFADTSEDLEGCGNCIYIDRDMLLYAGYHTIIAKSISTSYNRYFSYLFQTDCWRFQIRRMVNGVKLFSIPQKLLASADLIVPSTQEQQSIADYLDQRCSKIDELISIKQQKIEKLKEYKKSLIFECVTGKRKVS